jgi:hypothetical protein
MAGLVLFSSPPPCGEGLGVGVVRLLASANAHSARVVAENSSRPPPHPSPQGGGSHKVVCHSIGTCS